VTDKQLHDEILAELGFRPEEIAELRRAGAL